MSGPRVAGGSDGRFADRRCHHGIDFAIRGKLDGALDGGHGESPGFHGLGAGPPVADGEQLEPLGLRQARGAHQNRVGIDAAGLEERPGGYLRADAPGIAQGNGDSRPLASLFHRGVLPGIRVIAQPELHVGLLAQSLHDLVDHLLLLQLLVDHLAVVVQRPFAGGVELDQLHRRELGR